MNYILSSQDIGDIHTYFHQVYLLKHEQQLSLDTSFFLSILAALHSMQDLSSPKRGWTSWTQAPAVEAWSSNHWTIRDIPPFFLIYIFLYFSIFYQWIQIIFIIRMMYISIKFTMILTVFKIKLKSLHSAPVALCDLALCRFCVLISGNLWIHFLHTHKTFQIICSSLDTFPYSLIPPPSSDSSFKLVSSGCLLQEASPNSTISALWSVQQPETCWPQYFSPHMLFCPPSLLDWGPPSRDYLHFYILSI